ncbi:unnamed protein product [Aspergillus oryzae]|uniref:Unnamed protein product n=1 Tax=Aspergillus oryzae TaxID=5062 RepID=A0AAN5BTN7_ASPOZ|nr:unnamed protein product [Aspergillus oryzae]
MASELKANEPNVAVWRETVTDFTAGAAGGAAQVLIGESRSSHQHHLGPVEHIRIRLQTQPHGAARIYNGPLGCALKLIGTAGIASIYRGQAVILLREIHGYGVWLAAYEGLVGIAMARQQKEREELPS